MLKSPSPASSGQGGACETDPPSQRRPGTGQPPSILLVAVHLLLRGTFTAHLPGEGPHPKAVEN